MAIGDYSSVSGGSREFRHRHFLLGQRWGHNTASYHHSCLSHHAGSQEDQKERNEADESRSEPQKSSGNEAWTANPQASDCNDSQAVPAQ
jgi:hypothetical protein